MEILTTVLILVTAIYVYFTYRIGKANEHAVKAMQDQIEASKDAAEATLIHAFLDDYFNESMSEALPQLQDWKEQNGESFASEWLNHFRAGDEKAYKVDIARRRVKGYFEKAARIYSAGLIRPKILREIANIAGINIFYDIADALECEFNPNHSSQTLELLQQECGRHKESEKVPTISPQLDNKSGPNHANAPDARRRADPKNGVHRD